MVVRFLLSLVCLLFVACAGRNGSGGEMSDSGLHFPDSMDVKWTYVTGDDMMPNPRCFAVDDSCVYVLGDAGGRSLFVYNITTGEEMGSYIDRRSHIGELTNPYGLSIDRSTGDFGVFNLGMTDRFLVRYSPEYEPKALYRVDSVFPINDIVLAPDDRVIAVSLVYENGEPTGRQAVSLLDVADGVTLIGSCDELLPVIPKGLGREISVSGSGKRVASIIRNSGFLETYEITGDSISRTSHNNYFPIEVSDDGIAHVNHNIQYGFRCVAVSDDYVYAVYSESKVEGDPVTTVGVWDWNGNPVKKIKTDKNVSDICVSPDGSRLYCTSKFRSSICTINYIDL